MFRNIWGIFKMNQVQMKRNVQGYCKGLLLSILMRGNKRYKIKGYLYGLAGYKETKWSSEGKGYSLLGVKNGMNERMGKDALHCF